MMQSNFMECIVDTTKFKMLFFLATSSIDCRSRKKRRYNTDSMWILLD